MTPQQLKLIYLQLNHTDWDELCWLAILFSFRTLLRKSNFLLDGGKGDQHLLRRSDIEIGPELIIVNVRSTKTLLRGVRTLRIPVAKSSDPVFDLVQRLTRHFVEVPMDNDSFVF